MIRGMILKYLRFASLTGMLPIAQYLSYLARVHPADQLRARCHCLAEVQFPRLHPQQQRQEGYLDGALSHTFSYEKMIKHD